MGLFSASEAATSDKLNAMAAYVLKAADESVTSSTTLQNDDHLTYTLPATGTYVFDFWVYAVSAANAAGDLNLSVSFPTGTCHWGVAGNDPTLATSVNGTWTAGGQLSATSGTSVHGLGLSTSTTQCHLHGVLIATATGSLRLMWCQNSSNANASTVKAGSHMRVTRVA